MEASVTRFNHLLKLVHALLDRTTVLGCHWQTTEADKG